MMDSTPSCAAVGTAALPDGPMTGACAPPPDRLGPPPQAATGSMPAPSGLSGLPGHGVQVFARLGPLVCLWM